MVDLLDKCFEASSIVMNTRDVKDVTIKLTEECGEIAQEISKLNISNYKMKFTETGENITNRAICECGDALNCITDLVYLLCGCNEESAKFHLTQAVQAGLDKWKRKYNV